MHIKNIDKVKIKSIFDKVPRSGTIEDIDMDRYLINKQHIRQFLDSINIVPNKNSIQTLFWNSFNTGKHSNKSLLKTLCWRLTPQRLV